MPCPAPTDPIGSKLTPNVTCSLAREGEDIAKDRSTGLKLGQVWSFQSKLRPGWMPSQSPRVPEKQVFQGASTLANPHHPPSCLPCIWDYIEDSLITWFWSRPITCSRLLFVFSLQNLLKNFIQMNWYALPASYLASLVENQSWSAKSTKLTALLRSLLWIFEEVALENSIIQVQCGLKRLGRHLIEYGTSSRDAESPSNMKILKYLSHRLSSFCNIPPSNHHHLVFQRTRCKSIFLLDVDFSRIRCRAQLDTGWKGKLPISFSLIFDLMGIGQK